MRLTSTRWPTCSVGTIDSLGIRYGLTRNAWMPSASPSATATISDELEQRAGRRRPALGHACSSPADASSAARPRRPAAPSAERPRPRRRGASPRAGASSARRPRRLGLARRRASLVDGLPARPSARGCLGRRVVQQARARRPPPGRCSGARGRGRACRRGRAGSRAWRAGRRRGRRPRSARSSASARGNVRSTPTPKDCLRTVKVSRTPWPWRLMTTPSKTWVRRRVPSMTWKWTRTRSPAWNAGRGAAARARGCR